MIRDEKRTREAANERREKAILFLLALIICWTGEEAK